MQEHNPFNPRSQSASSPRGKRLGGYLVEAGLLTPAQIDVALNDQKNSGMRFGEVLAARGWVKQQTIEYLMQKVILPEQRALEQEDPTATVDEYQAITRDKRFDDVANPLMPTEPEAPLDGSQREV